MIQCIGDTKHSTMILAYGTRNTFPQSKCVSKQNLICVYLAWRHVSLDPSRLFELWHFHSQYLLYRLVHFNEKCITVFFSNKNSGNNMNVIRIIIIKNKYKQQKYPDITVAIMVFLCVIRICSNWKRLNAKHLNGPNIFNIRRAQMQNPPSASNVFFFMDSSKR